MELECITNESKVARAMAVEARSRTSRLLGTPRYSQAGKVATTLDTTAARAEEMVESTAAMVVRSRAKMAAINTRRDGHAARRAREEDTQPSRRTRRRVEAVEMASRVPPAYTAPSTLCAF